MSREMKRFSLFVVLSISIYYLQKRGDYININVNHANFHEVTVPLNDFSFYSGFIKPLPDPDFIDLSPLGPSLTNITIENRSLLTDFDFTLPQSRINDYSQFNIRDTVIKIRNDIETPIYKTYIYKRNVTQSIQPLVYVGNDFNLDWITKTYIHAVFYEGVDIIILKNGYVHGWDVFGTNSYLYDLFEDNGMYNPVEAQQKNNKRTVSGYRYVLAPIARWFPVFGHWITDTICPLMFVDDWIWDLKPVLCVPTISRGLVDEYMKIIGREGVEVVYRSNGFVYGENMFIVKGFGHEIPGGVHSLPILREKIARFYGLEKIKPENYVYMNKQNSFRYIRNLGEIIAAIEKENSIQFQQLRVNSPNRESFAKSIAAAKILVSPSGSITLNVIMMKANTGFLSLNSKNIDSPNVQMASHLHMWHIEIIHPKIEHFGSGVGNVTRALYSFKVLDFAVKNQRWPQNTLYMPYNLTLFREKLKGGINMTLLLQHLSPEIFMKYKATVDYNSI